MIKELSWLAGFRGQEGLGHPAVVIAFTPQREGACGPFKVVGGGSLCMCMRGLLSVAGWGVLVRKPLY